MVGRKALRLVSVAAIASVAALFAAAETRAANSELAGVAFPSQSRDWSSDPGGYKAASLDLAAALTGKACGPEEFHVWTIGDFAAGVALSESVDEAFRSAGWTLDLISRDSELSRIYLARRGEEALILNWLPDEGVVGLLICMAAEPGSVPERVAAAAPTRGFSLDPTMPPLPRPAPPRGQGTTVVADAGAASPVALPAVGVPAEVAAPPLPAGNVAAVAVDAAAGAAAPTSVVEGPPFVEAAAANPPTAVPPPPDPALPATAVAILAPEPPAAAEPAPQVVAAGAGTIPTAAPGPAPPVPAPQATIAAPSPTRTPIDLGMTAAIAGPAPGSQVPPAAPMVVAAAETAPAPGTAPGESISAMYERVPPPPGLVSPRSVAEHPVGPAVRPEGAAPSMVPARPVSVVAQTVPVQAAPPGAAASEGIQGEPVPVTTVLAPAMEPRGIVWPFFLLAVLLAGAALVILLRRRPPSEDPRALWPTALASVVSTELDERLGSEGIQFTPVLRYRFAVGENEFEAVTEGWGGQALRTRSAAEAVLANFPEHARVEISYDPTDPTRIALPEAETPPDPMLMVAAACLGLAAITLVLTLI